MPDPLIYVRSFPLAMFLLAKGIRPIGAKIGANGANGLTIWCFGPAAQALKEEFFAAQDLINDLADQAHRDASVPSQ